MAGEKNRNTLITRRGMVTATVRADEDGDYIAEPFTYSVVFPAVTGLNPSFSSTINIQADADFAILQSTYDFALNTAATDTPAAELKPNMSILITDTGSGRQFMDRLVPINNLFGDAKLPYVWPVPRLLAASSTMQLQLACVNVLMDFGASVYTLTLSFQGEKRLRLN